MKKQTAEVFVRYYGGNRNSTGTDVNMHRFGLFAWGGRKGA